MDKADFTLRHPVNGIAVHAVRPDGSALCGQGPSDYGGTVRAEDVDPIDICDNCVERMSIERIAELYGSQ